MIEILNTAFQNPNKKQCFFAGQNNPAIGAKLGFKQWDWTPQQTINVEPWFWNTHTLALAFGCEKTFTSQGKEWIKDLITSPEQLKDIKIPNVWDGRTGEILRKMQEMLVTYPEDTLIRLPDIQSPLGVVELMWDQSFYLELLMNTNPIHNLLEKVTTFTIDYVNEIKKVLGNRHNPSTHPQIWSTGDGYYMSDDVNSMVSPEQHLEFSINYFNRITKALGPLHYHSCTWSDMYLDNIDKLEGVKTANWSFGTSTDPAKILERFSGKFMLVPFVDVNIHKEAGVDNLNKNINSEVELVKYVLDHMQSNSSLFFCFSDEICKDVDKMVAFYKLFDKYGYSPQSQGF